MSEREWKPKVGEKVSVTGYCVIGNRWMHWTREVFPVTAMTGDVVTFQGPDGPWCTNLRNLDPVLEDERTGKPRPPIKNGETVEILCRVIADCGYAVLQPEHLRLDSPRVRQIERRRENMGREARKS